MAARRALVTGGTGFLGLNLIEQLCAQGWEVSALHRPSARLDRIRRFPVRLAPGDLLDPASLERALVPAPDAVFHVAADTSVWRRHAARQTRINVDGTRNLVAAARAAAVPRFVHTSTWNVYGLEQGALTEDAPKHGGSSWITYNRTKFLAEQAVLGAVERGLPAVVINPAHIMGRYDAHGWARLIIAVHEGWLPFAPPGAGSFCHGAAVARAHIAAAERGRVGQNYLLGGADADFLELFRVIGAVTGRKVPTRTLPAPAFRLVAHGAAALARITRREPLMTPEGVAIACARLRVVSSRAEDELGYRPAPLRAMVEDSHAWLRSAGLLPAA